MAEGFVDNWELTGAEHLYYTRQHKGNKGGAIMEKQEYEAYRKEELLYRMKNMLDKIDDLVLLQRIYRFIKYIYVHMD